MAQGGSYRSSDTVRQRGCFGQGSIKGLRYKTRAISDRFDSSGDLDLVPLSADRSAQQQSSPGLAYGGSIEVRPMADECPLDVRARELAREEQLVNA